MTKKKDPKDLIGAGRPTVMTPEILTKLEIAFKLGEDDRLACSYAGISPSTLYDYQKKFPEFAEQKEQWKKNPIHRARMALFNSLDDPKWAAWLLERKCKEEFSTRQEITGRDGESLVPVIEIQPVKTKEG